MDHSNPYIPATVASVAEALEATLVAWTAVHIEADSLAAAEQDRRTKEVTPNDSGDDGT